MTSDQLKSTVQGAHKFDLGIMGAGVLAFLLSLFPYYTFSLDAGFGMSGGTSVTAWHGFFGWFAALAALAGAVLTALPLLGVRLSIPTRLAAVAAFGLATLCVLLALFVIPGKGDCQGLQACEDAISYGHGFGYWASVLVILAGLALSVMRMGAKD